MNNDERRTETTAKSRAALSSGRFTEQEDLIEKKTWKTGQPGRTYSF